jgi:nucleoside-triphosphatase
MERNLLITGLPGTGKTTVVMRLADRLKRMKAAGFYTEEIRTGGARKPALYGGKLSRRA